MKIRHENTSYQTDGELPKVGSRAPDVSLVNTSLHNVSLADFMGARKILNIVTSVDTDADAASVLRFDRLGAGCDNLALLVVSYDLPFAHQRFQRQNGLDNVVGLSAIRHAGFGENYGVQILDGPYAGMFSRAVVVLDENNTVVHREHLEDMKAEPDYEAAFRALGIEINE